MAAKAVPDGYNSVSPYLLIQGAEKLIDFLKAAFDATEIMRTTGSAGGMHAEVRIGDTVVMMGDVGPKGTPMPAAMYLYIDDVDARYAKALKAGGTSMAEPKDQVYGDRSATVKDPCGNIWFVAHKISH